jgi:isoaspartyl peptidase/L-asparaginase-like protein (Ntn-hydrolase superfamily)
MSQFVIAVHCGAGYHSTSDEARLCNAMGRALSVASAMALTPSATAESICAAYERLNKIEYCKSH